MKKRHILHASGMLRSIEASLFDDRIALSERITMFFVSSIAMFITLLVMYFMVSSVLDILLAALIERWFWVATGMFSLAAGLLGFILGSEKMTDVFGFLWRTNGKME